MNSFMKKTAAVLLAFSVAVQLVSCGGGSGSGSGSSSQGGSAAPSGSENAGSYDTVYTVKPITIDEDLVGSVSNLGFRKLRACGGRLFALTTFYSDFGTVEQILNFEQDGSDLQMGDILSITDGEYIDSSFDSDGNLYVLRLMQGVSAEPFPGSGSGFDEADSDVEEGPVSEEGVETEEPAGPDIEAAEQAAQNEEETDEISGPDFEGSVEMVDGPGGASSGEYTAEEVESTDMDTDYSGETPTSAYTLFCYEPDGSIVWEAEIPQESELYYAGQLICVPDGLVISDSNGLSLMSKEDGSFLNSISKEDDLAGCSIYGLEDGTIAVWAYGSEGQEIRAYTAQGEKKGSYPIHANAQFTSMFPGSGYALYMVSDKGIYGMNLDDSEPVKVLDYLDSDLDILSVDAFCELDSESFAAALINGDGDTEICQLRKVDPEVAANRTVLTLGCYNTKYEVRREVLSFNKTNESVRIRILDYADYDSDTGSEGLTRLNADIASGNAPDIIMLSYAMPLKSYIAKGVLEDITPFFTSDGDLQKSEFLTNVMDAFKTDGKMYTIVPAFYVMTLIGYQEDIGDPSTFTLDRVKEVSSRKGTDLSKAFGIVQRDILLYNALELCGERFLDWENSTCSFNGEEFISLLEFLQMFPGRLNEAETMVDTTADYRNGTSLFYLTSLGNFDDYTYIRYGIFGDEIEMTGFPSMTGAEAAISPQMQIAMSSTAKDKDAAWQFIRRFLLPDYQKSIDFYYWPVSETALDALAQVAQEPHYYDDGTGNLEESPVIVSIGGEMLELPVLSSAETEKIKDFLRSIDHAIYIDNSIENIITEEAEAFFSGQKSAKDVADIIQSRAQIYINENS